MSCDRQSVARMSFAALFDWFPRRIPLVAPPRSCLPKQRAVRSEVHIAALGSVPHPWFAQYGRTENDLGSRASKWEPIACASIGFAQMRRSEDASDMSCSWLVRCDKRGIGELPRDC